MKRTYEGVPESENTSQCPAVVVDRSSGKLRQCKYQSQYYWSYGGLCDRHSRLLKKGNTVTVPECVDCDKRKEFGCDDHYGEKPPEGVVIERES